MTRPRRSSSGGIIFLFGGPLLTEKRLYRRLIYPLLPVNAIIGRLSPFRIKVDRGVCMDCEMCEETCEDLLRDQRITSQRREVDGVYQMRQMHGYLPQRGYRISSNRNRDRRSSHIRRTGNSQTNSLPNIRPEAPTTPPRNEFGGVVPRGGSRIRVSADRGGMGGRRFVVSKDLLF